MLAPEELLRRAIAQSRRFVLRCTYQVVEGQEVVFTFDRDRAYQWVLYTRGVCRGALPVIEWPALREIRTQEDAQAAFDDLLATLAAHFGPPPNPRYGAYGRFEEPTNPGAESAASNQAESGNAGATTANTTPDEQMSVLGRVLVFMWDRKKQLNKLATLKEIVDAIPEAKRSTLYANPEFRSTRKAIKISLRANIPAGHRTDTGGLEAVAEDEEE
jgi:hypothetical protein